jgi:hypothetical protein
MCVEYCYGLVSRCCRWLVLSEVESDQSSCLCRRASLVGDR